MEGEQFLKERFSLHASKEVKDAARKTQLHTGEKVPQDPLAQIQNYFDRLDHIINPPTLEGHPDFDRGKRNIEMLKPTIVDKFITKFEDIPQSYWKAQERILRERGQIGDYNRFSDEQKNEWKKLLTGGLLEDQRASLEQWVDYLASPDMDSVPSYVKYWVFRGVVGLSEYDKKEKAYPNRSKGTVNMFPDINAEALGYVMDALLKKHRGLPLSFDMLDEHLLGEEREKLKNEFKILLETENFAKLYGWANEQIRPMPERLMPITDGKWIKYSKGSNHRPLVASIRGRGTGWCTSGESFAISQLKGGDFYVYYSNDESGNSIYPRIAIRMGGSSIAEIRGIAPGQNLDPYMLEVIEPKLYQFPDKDKYLKKERDMRRVTEIEKRVDGGDELDKDDVLFLFEIGHTISGFGQIRDPRISELRTKVGFETATRLAFGCEPEELARNSSQINEKTRIYVGNLDSGIFQKFGRYGVERVYTSFPENEIKIDNLSLDGAKLDELVKRLKAEGINISGIDDQVIRSSRSRKRELRVVSFSAADLGLKENELTLEKLYAKAKKLGLNLCPPDAGVAYRLKYRDQRPNEKIFIAMKPLENKNGLSVIFGLDEREESLWFSGYWMDPEDKINSRYKFVFAIPGK